MNDFLIYLFIFVIALFYLIVFILSFTSKKEMNDDDFIDFLIITDFFNDHKDDN